MPLGVADGAEHLRLLERAQAAAHAVRTPEAVLREEEASLRDAQYGHKAQPGDLVWHARLGFGRAQENALRHEGVKHFLDVRLAALASTRVAARVADVDACSAAG